MSDLLGKTLGPYRILEQIGVGGMATVYKAYQANMERYVAVKILPHYLSHDKEFARRFQREAHAIARLEHPHILPVFDYGETDGVTYIAMRYIKAGTLKQHLQTGLLPLGDIVRLIGQIGSALDYAHRQGVIHRDVKPGNVLIDNEGNTYLTDFGLARMLEASEQLTASGVGLGTPAYMSPEQGQGMKADHRSDIYSLGVILFEMVTGRVPYEAETPMAVVLKHISEPLPLPHAVNPNVSEPIERVILKALAKDPAHRYQSAGEMVQALTNAAQATGTAETPAVAKATPALEKVPISTRLQELWRQPRGKVLLAGGAVIVVLALALFLSQLPGRGQIIAPGATTTTIGQLTSPTRVTAEAMPLTPTRLPVTATPFPVPLPAVEGKWLVQCGNVKPIQICVEDIGTRQIISVTRDLNFGIVGAKSWSPDGQKIAFEAAQTEADPVMFYIINTDGTGLRLIKSGNAPTWSPDGQWIAFQREDGLWLIRPDGSDAHRMLANKPDQQFYPRPPAWSPDSQRLTFLNVNKAGTEIWVVNADGSEPRLVHASGQEFPLGSVSWSPDGQWIHWRRAKGDESSDAILPADGKGEPQTLTQYPVPDWWSTSFWPQWGDEAQAATPARPPATATPFPVPLPAVEGKWLIQCGNAKPIQICVEDIGARQITTVTQDLNFMGPVCCFSWSPDGQQIAFSAGQTDFAPLMFYLINADGTDLRLVKSGNVASWSPDGQWIAFQRDDGLWLIRPDGSDARRMLANKPDQRFYPVTPAWSPNSQRLAFLNFNKAGTEVWVVNADGSEPHLIHASDQAFDGGYVSWSPDSQWIHWRRGKGDVSSDVIIPANGKGEPQTLTQYPADWWRGDFWPPWGGEAQR